MRRLFTAISAVSLVLYLTSVTFWARSFWLSSSLSYPTLPPETLNRNRYMLSFFRGYMYWSVARTTAGMAPPSSHGHPRPPVLTPPRHSWTYTTTPATGQAPFATLRRAWTHLGFSQIRATQKNYYAGGMTTSGTLTITIIPLYAPVVLFMILPLTWTLLTLRRRLRARSNSCPVCHYDLTANTSGVCPECGTSIAPIRVADAS